MKDGRCLRRASPTQFSNQVRSLAVAEKWESDVYDGLFGVALRLTKC
ncbi:hypothetical protein [Nostoc sp.]